MAVKIQNVVAYAESDIEGIPVDPVRLPNIAPPWPLFWMEFSYAGGEFGFCFRSERTPSGYWLTEVYVWMRFLEGDDELWLENIMFTFPVASDGTLARRLPPEIYDGDDALKPGFIPLTTASYDTAAQKWMPIAAGSKECGDLHSALIRPLGFALLAVTFCHCKGTEVVAEPVSRQVRRAAERQNRSLVRLYTLAIRPVQRILDEPRRLTGGSISRALHICRGHFKTYRERGLFGRFEGTFFFRQHIRGDAACGSIGKDYSIPVIGDGDRDLDIAERE